MFWRDQIDVMHPTNVLQLHVPFGELFWCEVKPIPLVGDVVVLTENAAKVAAREEDSTRTIVALKTRFYKMRN